ncbi:hypothetical protein ABPG72_015610 [Tetrahymena utriculariae]
MSLFPSNILKAAKKSKVMVELKSGDTYIGILEDADRFMNIQLTEVIFTSKDSKKFMNIDQIYIKGASLKYFQMDEAVIDKAIEEQEILNEQKEEAKNKMKQKKEGAATQEKDGKQKKKFEKSRGGYQGKSKPRGS